MSSSPSRSGLDRAALQRILEVTGRLAAPFDLTTMLSEVIDAATSVLAADRGAVFLYDPDRNQLYSKIATGVESLRFPVDRGIVGECVRTRDVVNVPDCYADERFNQAIDRKTGYRTRCVLTLPLVGHDDSLIGVLQLLNKKDGTFDATDETIARALAAQCAVALQRVTMMEAIVIKEKQDQELAVARGIQMGVLPSEMPTVPGYDLAGLCRPADETGGDIFDMVPLEAGRTVLLLGDATGHGVGPAISVTQVRAMLRMAIRLQADLDTIFVQINDQLSDDLASNRFVTAFLGLLDPGTHHIAYHAAGQAPLMHYHAADDRFEWFGASAPPLGMVPQTVRKRPGLDLAPGDILGVMTDGVFEAEDASEEQFGQERVEELVRRHGTGPMTGMAETIMGRVMDFAGDAPQADDITIVLVRRLPGT